MGTTVVGVSGHVVVKRNGDDKSVQREAMAKKIGFDAYAERKDMPDPIQNALDSILDHMHKVDEELEELKKKVKDN
jgi:serine O-acetyltransferase